MKLPLLAWAIMFAQKMLPWDNESFSHTAISYISITGKWKYADSTSKGVNDISEKIYLQKYEIIDTIIIDISARPEEFMDWFETHEGKKYDSLQIIGLLLKALGIISFNKIGNNYKKLICTELVISLLSRFKKLEVSDPDNYDLLMTWREAKIHAI